MRFSTLTVQNWGPFRGTQTVDLTCPANAPIILVYGENEHGKTSIFRALRWALYGEVRSAAGRLLSPEIFANAEELESGQEIQFGATLRFFTREDQELEISRVQKIKAAGKSSILSPVESSLRVIGGQPVAQADVDSTMKRILHPEIADFVLFDGEMLQRFEERLKTDEQTAKGLRHQIEMALGIPAMTLLRSDFDALLEETGAQVRRETKMQAEHKGLSEEYDRVVGNIQRVEADLETFRPLLEELQIAEKKLDVELEKHAASRDTHVMRNAAKDELEQLREDDARAREDLRGLCEKHWWLPLQPQLTAAYEHVSIELQSSRNALQEAFAIDREVERLRAQMNDTSCSQCGQSLPSDAIAKMSERLTELVKAQEARVSIDIDSLSAREQSLKRYAGASAIATMVRDREKEVQRLGLRIADKKRDIEALTAKLESAVDVNIVALESQRKDASHRARQMEDEISIAEDRLSGLRTERANLVNKLAAASPSSSGLKQEIAVLNRMRDAVDQSLQNFTNKMRLRVQESASRIFTSMSRQPDYEGLRIDGNFYLKIVDRADRTIEQRSAGADQLVTVALMGALAECAVDDGPLVIDTPFGRLDLVHRENMLKWLATQDRQIVLFVQSGEFERDRHLHLLNGRVGREYRLNKLTLTSSKLEAVSDV